MIISLKFEDCVILRDEIAAFWKLEDPVESTGNTIVLMRSGERVYLPLRAYEKLARHYSGAVDLSKE